jgi:hypothetical protein
VHRTVRNVSISSAPHRLDKKLLSSARLLKKVLRERCHQAHLNEKFLPNEMGPTHQPLYQQLSWQKQGSYHGGSESPTLPRSCLPLEGHQHSTRLEVREDGDWRKLRLRSSKQRPWIRPSLLSWKPTSGPWLGGGAHPKCKVTSPEGFKTKWDHWLFKGDWGE